MTGYCDIAVIGSGAAGIAAAVTAARAGCRTLLLDKNPAAGGTGGFSGLTTLCGLYDDSGNYINLGFAREFAEAIAETPARKMGQVWVLPYRPARFRVTAGKFFAANPDLETCWNSPLADVEFEEGQIVSVNGFRVGAVIDCSGNAEVLQAIGTESPATDDTTQAPAVVFPLNNVTREILTPAAAVQVLLPIGRAGFPPVIFQSNLEPNSVTVKFTGQPDRVPALIEFLRAKVPGFENCQSPQSEFPLIRRAGRMTIGEYLLTGHDVLSGKKFPDPVARCAWPVEQWNADGIIRLRYLPPRTYYEIPARSLRAAHVKNLFMAGKTISADADAIASARVMGCCLATGAAAGNLAVSYINSPK
jgi:hypothetical protein